MPLYLYPMTLFADWSVDQINSPYDTYQSGTKWWYSDGTGASIDLDEDIVYNGIKSLKFTSQTGTTDEFAWKGKGDTPITLVNPYGPTTTDFTTMTNFGAWFYCAFTPEAGNSLSILLSEDTGATINPDVALVVTDTGMTANTWIWYSGVPTTSAFSAANEVTCAGIGVLSPTAQNDIFYSTIACAYRTTAGYTWKDAFSAQPIALNRKGEYSWELIGKLIDTDNNEKKKHQLLSMVTKGLVSHDITGRYGYKYQSMKDNIKPYLLYYQHTYNGTTTEHIFPVVIGNADIQHRGGKVNIYDFTLDVSLWNGV